MKTLQYLKYIFKHKYYVMVECCRLAKKYNKYSLIWRGIVHDMSKFSKKEFFPYVNYFYGKYGIRYSENYKLVDHLKKHKIDNSFNKAWNNHQKRNKHHYQYWILLEDDGNVIKIEIDDIYMYEMIADWVGAGKAIGNKSPKNDVYHETRNWYYKNKDKIVLNFKTRKKVEAILNDNQ